MYKEFHTLEELYHEVESDKNYDGVESASYNRYPIRFVLFENFNDFADFVQFCSVDYNIVVQSLDKWLPNESQDDKMLTYSQLASIIESYSKQLVNDVIIAPFSEIARFYDNMKYHEFDSLLKTIRLIQPSPKAYEDNPLHRVYIPIIGMQSKINKFKNDPVIFIWNYLSGKECKNYRLILTAGTTYGVKGLEKDYTLCENFRQWVALWKSVGVGIKSQIISSSKCIFNNAENAQPDNAFEYTICNNVFEFLKDGLGLDLDGLSLRQEDLPNWEKLAQLIDIKDFDFDTFVYKHFNISTIDEDDFVKIWFEYKDNFDRWLLKMYFLRKQEKNSYLQRVLENCQTQSTPELFSLLATQIFEEPIDNNSLQQRRVLLEYTKEENVQIVTEEEKRIEKELLTIAQDPERGYKVAMEYMTSFTISEQCLMMKWIGSRHVNKQDIQNIFPELYTYLTQPNIQTEECNKWINEYFYEYTLSKVANKPTKEFTKLLNEKNASQTSFESWRNSFKTVKTILHNRQDIDLYYWIDGLGVDWIPFIIKIIEKHRVDCVYLNEIYVATADLPTITSVNKIKLEELSNDKLEKIGDIDSFAHSQKSYPKYLIDEFRIVEEAISEVLSQYNGKKIAFVSDHGISYMAQCGKGLNMAGIKANHSGRCAEWQKGDIQSDNNYIILEDGKTLCALKNNSLTDKTPSGQGAHGGVTPEEVLVPIIIVSNQENANNFSVQIKNREIKGTDPYVQFEIKGLSSIDCPSLVYNNRNYQLYNKSGNTFESEKLDLDNTENELKVVIGQHTYPFKVKVETGVEETELF
jgi:hypothetical protein